MTDKPKTYLTRRQLQDRWGGKSHMFVEDLLRKDATFPRPVKLGGGHTAHRLWPENEIEAWERSKIARSSRMIKTAQGTSVPFAEIVSMSGGAHMERVVATLKDGSKVELQARNLNEV